MSRRPESLSAAGTFDPKAVDALLRLAPVPAMCEPANEVRAVLTREGALEELGAMIGVTPYTGKTSRRRVNGKAEPTPRYRPAVDEGQL